MRRRFALPVALLALVLSLSGVRPAAQELVWARFEQYLDALRQQAGIPGLSGLILQNQRVVWENGFGFADVEAGIRATPNTPYHIAGLTQPIAAALVFLCAERGQVNLTAPIRDLVPGFPDAGATIAHVLSHTAETGSFRYDIRRYAALADVVDRCSDVPFRVALAREILDRLAMRDSVPGADIEQAPGGQLQFFDGSDRARYGAVLRQLAKPYRVDRNNRASPSSYPAVGLDASGGIVSTVRDLGRFEAALADEDLLDRRTLTLAWSPRIASDGRPQPHGLGWFVQSYNGERLVWQYGLWSDATASLVLKVPGRGLTLVLLANSDKLNASFQLQNGDVTSSLFARLFLRLFV